MAAAVILPEGFDLDGIDDSKKVPRDKRQLLADRIRESAVYAIEVSEVDEVDRLNVLWASMAAMRRALDRLPSSPCRVYIDGNRLPGDLPWPCEAVIKGDGRIACIAAASILAKTERDRLMTEYAVQYPGYGFERHFGYSTPEHLEALRAFGPCALHRRSFSPVREMLEQPCLSLDV